jgi:signal transduction histidine kinase
VLHANGAATELLGAGLVGDPLDERLPDGGGTTVGAAPDSDLIVETDGGRRHFDVEQTPYTDHRGQERGEIYTFKEVTDRQESAEELARQNERLDRFASFVSHDLRSPLFVASARLDLVREEVPDEHAEAMARSFDRMETMIEDLLAMARAGQRVEETRPVVLAEAVEQARIQVDLAGADFENEVPAALTVRADEDRLLHVLENLLRNAVDHNDEPPTVRVGALDGADGSVAGLFVEDDGVGIPPADRETVFEHGYTDSEDGNGLGLSLVADIVEAHGWEIRVTDGRDGGVRFEIRGVEGDRE